MVTFINNSLRIDWEGTEKRSKNGHGLLLFLLFLFIPCFLMFLPGCLEQGVIPGLDSVSNITDPISGSSSESNTSSTGTDSSTDSSSSSTQNNSSNSTTTPPSSGSSDNSDTNSPVSSDLVTVNTVPVQAGYPNVMFTIDTFEGTVPLTITCTVFTLDGNVLPEGTYTWKFDDVESIGSAQAQVSKTHTFSEGGIHTVGLTLTLGGLTVPIACEFPPDTVSTAKAAPPISISGYIRNKTGAGVGGVTVSANNRGGTAVTNSLGFYRLAVPFLWTGTIISQNAGYTFNPANRAYTSKVTKTLFNQNFTATAVTMPNNPPVAEAGLNQTLTDTNGDGTESITLDGSGSTDDFGITTYVWKEGTTQLGTGKTVTVPLGLGAHTITLTVTDMGGLASLDTVTITVNTVPNKPPTAEAGPNQAVTDSDADGVENIILDGSGSTDDFGITGYVWKEGTTPLGTGKTVTVSLGVGVHTVTLTVTDKEGLPTSDTVGVSIFSANGLTAENMTFSVIKETSCSATNRLFLRAQSSLESNPDVVILSLPANGRLQDELNNPISAVPFTLAGNRVKYIPSTSLGAGSQDGFTWQAKVGSVSSNVATASIQIVDWTAPIGVPEPEFGIRESHRMYQGQMFDFDQDGVAEAAYKDAGNGPYTHYVDVSSPAATDTNNPCGTPATPRQTIPNNLRPGSVVEVHGGIYTAGTLYGGSAIGVTGNGTLDKPIFVRGANVSIRPVFKNSILVRGQYLIVENMEVTEYPPLAIYVLPPSDHIAIRHCEVHGSPVEHTSAIAVTKWDSDPTINDQIVIYDNTVHDNGDWANTQDVDLDHQGVSVTGPSQNVWIVDNDIYHNSGSATMLVGSQQITHHIYVGRNHTWENRQSGPWVKQASDVILSQNEVDTQHVGAFGGALGFGMGMQYGPERVWYLFNVIHDVNYAITFGSNNGTDQEGKNTYIIGNVMYNCSSYGVLFWGNPGLTVHVVGNTISNAKGGIHGETSGALRIVNNIICRQGTDLDDISILWGDMANASTVSNNLFHGDSPACINWGGLVYNGLGPFQSATGKGQGCIDADPKFRNAAHRDFHLQAGSPAIDAGVVSDVYQTFYTLYGIDLAKDIEGKSQPQGSGWDIGAYAYSGD